MIAAFYLKLDRNGGDWGYLLLVGDQSFVINSVQNTYEILKQYVSLNLCVEIPVFECFSEVSEHLKRSIHTFKYGTDF